MDVLDTKHRCKEVGVLDTKRRRNWVDEVDTKHRCKRAWGYWWRTCLQSKRRSSMYVHQGVSTHFETKEIETDDEESC